MQLNGLKTMGCDNADCSVSSGAHIHDTYPGYTFGSGELDRYGYWENPCHVCAREHEHRYPEDGPCWLFETNGVELRSI